MLTRQQENWKHVSPFSEDSHMRRNKEAAATWFYRRILNRRWVSEEETRKSSSKCQQKENLSRESRRDNRNCLHMRQECLESITRQGVLEVRGNRMQWATTQTSLGEWMTERWVWGGLSKGRKLLRAIRDRKLWRTIIAHILQGRGT